MARIVLLGVGLSARLAHFYLTHDSPHEVAAFSVDRDYTSSTTLGGLPIVPFDEVKQRFPAHSHQMLVAVGYGRMNKFRERRFQDAKELGYDLISYVSSRATRWPDTEIGENCFIMEETTIQPFARIGNNVTLWSAAHIGPGSHVGDHSFVSSHAVIANGVTVGRNCFVGVNATVDEALTLGAETVVGAGAHITESTHEREVYAGPRAVQLPLTSDRLPAV